METNTLISFDNLAAVMNEYGEAVKAAYQKELAERGKNASGNLSRNIHVIIDGGGDVFGGAHIEVMLELPAYWFNVEYGRKPCPPSKHWVPVDKLIKWIEVKKIIPRPDKNGHVPTTKQLAFLINRAINDPDRRGGDPPRPGIAPTPAMQSALDEVNRRFDAAIRNAVSEDLGVFLKTVSFSEFDTRGHGRANVVRGPHKK